jgi:hypothetical protein
LVAPWEFTRDVKMDFPASGGANGLSRHARLRECCNETRPSPLTIVWPRRNAPLGGPMLPKHAQIRLRTRSMQARRRAGLRSFPVQPRRGSSCPESDQRLRAKTGVLRLEIFQPFNLIAPQPAVLLTPVIIRHLYLRGPIHWGWIIAESKSTS